MSAVPLPAAAVALRTSVPTLKRWIRSGAPVARRGGRGRGRATLVSPEAVAAWRASAVARPDLAAIPDILAAAISETFDRASGLPKQRMAGLLAECWYEGATRIMDHLREQDASVPDVSTVPLVIERLRKVASR